MLPTLPFLDVAHSLVRDAELARNFGHVPPILSKQGFDLEHGLGIQLAIRTLFTGRASSLALHIGGIFRRGAEEQVGRIHAGTHIASVTYDFSCRNLAAEQLPRKAMGSASLTRKIGTTISISRNVRCPQPASTGGILAYPGHEFFFECELHSGELSR